MGNHAKQDPMREYDESLLRRLVSPLSPRESNPYRVFVFAVGTAIILTFLTSLIWNAKSAMPRLIEQYHSPFLDQDGYPNGA